MDPKSFFGWMGSFLADGGAASQAIFILRGVFLRRKCPKVFDGGQWSVAPHPFLKVWIYILLPSLQQPRKRKERSCKVPDGICKKSKQVALGPLDMGL